jgi:5-methylcytosine-specific restriction endonuclease McrA
MTMAMTNAEKCALYRERHPEYLDWHAKNRRENPDKVKGAIRKWREEHRDELIQKKRQYRAENLELVKSQEAASRSRNREAIRARKAKYYADNAEAINAARAERRRTEWYDTSAGDRVRRMRLAGQAKIPGDLLKQRWAYYAGRCWMCGGQATSWDHVKPLSKRGPHLLSNLRPACEHCNKSKHAKWPFVVERKAG